MLFFKRGWISWVTLIAIGAVTLTGLGAQRLLKQTFAPHELNRRDAPPPIIAEPPPLPNSPIHFDSAEERHLRVVVVAKGLQQPWSIAFFRRERCS